MASNNIHNGLMRPAVLQIFRAAGFHNTSGAVLDVMTDLAVRYLLLLASTTAHHAVNNHNDCVATVQDIRMAMVDLGVLVPQMSPLEEKARGSMMVEGGSQAPFEDMRGTNGFLKWVTGPTNREIRRIAGLTPSFSNGVTDAVDVGLVLDENEDYVTALKKKNHRAGEESRYQGTLLGKEADDQPVAIVGGGVSLSSIHDWTAHILESRTAAASAASSGGDPSEIPPVPTPESSAISSAPLTPIDEPLVPSNG